jgi:Ni/Co efflux regulator RcnB
MFERVVRQEREDRQDRQERREQAAAAAASVGSEPEVRPERRQERRERRLERNERRQERGESWAGPDGSMEEGPAGEVMREQIMRERGDRRDRSLGTRPTLPPVAGDAMSSGVPSTVEPPFASSSSTRGDRRRSESLRNRIATEGWRREWREDRRFDWRRHRDRDRSRFRLGFYYDPFGWSYRRWNLGWNLPSRFYSSRYWINDPFHYSLPPAYGPYRWVRYWNDALLVDLRTGRVVDAIPNFFW